MLSSLRYFGKKAKGIIFSEFRLRISLEDERTDRQDVFEFEGGIGAFVEHLNKNKTPLFRKYFTL